MISEGETVMERGAPQATKITFPTLKELYRLLTQKDFPDYSYPVFSARTMKGQTLVRFWRSLLEDALPREIDLSIFDLSEKRSRSLTKLLNGSGEKGFMSGWHSRLSDGLNTDLLLQMSGAWSECLEQGHYHPGALTVRLLAYFDALIQAGTLGACENCIRQLREDLSARAENRAGAAGVPELFLHAVSMSWLTLFALYASQPDNVSLLRIASAYTSGTGGSLYSAWKASLETDQPLILSARGTLLDIPRLSSGAFIGRQTELRQAEAGLLAGGKLAITGMGGVGKTELTRQLMARFFHMRLWQRAAYVQYSYSPTGSWFRAFPEFRDLPPEEIQNRVRALLEEPGSGRTLLVIDNAESERTEEQAWLGELLEWKCDIILTTRLAGLEGWPCLELRGLAADAAQALFEYRCPEAGRESGAVRALCGELGGNPLAVTLMADLCRARRWSVKELQKHLIQQGPAELSYKERNRPVDIPQVLGETFSMAGLESLERKMLRLMALLPYGSYQLETLAPLAKDIAGRMELLSMLCEELAELGWLKRSEQGFSLHPLIAETVRLMPVSANEFPALWPALSNPEDPECCRMLLSVALRTGEWNAACAGAVAGMTHMAAHTAYLALPDQLFEKWRDWLDLTEHGEAEEADYQLGFGIRDILYWNRYDRLGQCLEKLFVSKDVIHGRENEIYILLEYACQTECAETADRLFRHMIPDHPKSVEMARWLISWSVRQQSGEHDPRKALESLARAEEILKAHGMTESLEQSNLLYRQGVCLLDLGRSAEAAPRLGKCLRILAAHGRAANTPNMMSTRVTYAVALQNCGETEKALAEYESLSAQYREQQRQNTSKYAVVRNNAALLLDGLGQYEEAEMAIRETLRIDEETQPQPSIRATHQRNAALILSHLHRDAEAERMAASACTLREETYGAASPWTADARAVHALTLYQLGRKEEAAGMIEEAWDRLQSAWGPEHRHTVNASAIRERIIQGRGA